MFCPRCGSYNLEESTFCMSCGSILRGDPAAANPGDPREADETGREPGDPSLEAGQVFEGRYVIQEELGQGPLGTVYLVFDQTEGDWRALKVLRWSGDPQAMARLAEGLWQWRSLNHPGLVALFEADLEADSPYYTMEYVPGSSLSQILDEWREAGRTMDLRRAGTLVLSILAALAAAHPVMVHGDLKPENILIKNVEDELVVKITDWGLNAALPPLELRSLAQSQGTMDYVSPERLQGQARLTPAADLFSTGVILYEMMTGVTPSGPFDPPSRLVSGLTLEVDQLLEKSLSTWPEERFASADRFEYQLRRVMESTRPQGPPQPRARMNVKPEPVAFRPETLAAADQPALQVRNPVEDRTSGRIKWVWAVGLAAAVAVIIILARTGVLNWLVR